MRPAVALLLALLVGACGRFGSADSAVDTTATSTTSSTVTTTIAPPSTAGDGTTSSTTPGTTAAPTSTAPAVAANQASREDGGWLVTLTVGDRLEYPADTDEILIEVRYRNDAAEPGHILTEQPAPAILTERGSTDPVWDAGACNPTTGVDDGSGGSGTRIVEANESGRLLTRYPLREECRLPPGSYDVFGRVVVCRAGGAVESVNPGAFTCPETERVSVWAGPVGIELR